MNFFILKAIKNGVVVKECRTHSLRRFLKNLRTINWGYGGTEVYLKVDYGKHFNNYGNLSDFHNDGIYESEKDLWLAFKAFTEK